jgi:site-specific recombinase XerD
MDTISTPAQVDSALGQPAGQPLAVTPWRIVIDAYLAAGVDSDHTRRAYRRHIEQACTAMGVDSLADMNGAMLATYRTQVTGSNLAPATQAQALAALRSCLRWARTMGAHQLPDEVIKVALRTPRATVQRPYAVLSEPEIAAMLAAAQTARDKALLAVLFGAGLRVAEAAALDVGDVQEDGDGETVLHVRQGKGRKDRTVPVQADVARLLRSYLSQTGRRLGDSGPLFRAHDRAAKRLPRARLTVRAIAYVVERTARMAGIEAKAISPHSLRHTYALRALRHGGNVVAVSKLLGHASISITQKYVDHLALAELRQAVPPLPAV